MGCPRNNDRSPFDLGTRRIGRVRILCLIGLGVALAPWGRPARADDGPWNEAHIQGRTLRVPRGFTIERAAGAPLVNRPITAAFDDQGRLYVSDSSGSNDPVQKQLAERPHRIVRLEDLDHDGKFDRRTVFADRMMFPEGTMWHDGSLYVSAPPSIWKLTDTDGDGVADRRSEWFEGKTLTGCANDLHGPYLGPDGWIYWCKGAFARQTYERPGQAPFVTSAAHIFRRRPDGTGLEPVMTGGMDNPVDVAFAPGGERIFTTTFLVVPGGGLRDGLVHDVYGGIYGKIHAPIFEPAHKWTGPEVMPVLLHMGPAAPCGLTRYESDAFGQPYRDNLFACYFNLHKLGRHVLEKKGATFETRDEDFVVSPDIDFHPTDVIEDADGSLLVVDTGGWYKLCCPTSQLHKPDVLGAIYRVRRAGAPKVDDPWGTKLTVDRDAPDHLARLARRLDDPRPAVRRRARDLIAAGPGPARTDAERAAAASIVAELRKDIKGASPRWLRNAAWTLARIECDEARALSRELLDAGDETVRQAALHVASLLRDRAAAPKLMELLGSPSPHNRRAAAEALGRVGAKSAVPALLKAAGTAADDRFLEHSITYALIEIGDVEQTRAGLSAGDPRVVRAALAALDQMGGGALDPKFVAGLLAASDPALKATASWIVGHHPDWAEALAGVLGDRLNVADLPAADRRDLERQLGGFAGSAPVQKLLAERLADRAAPLAARESCLAAMAAASLRPDAVPASWIAAWAAVLAHSRAKEGAPLVAPVIETVRARMPAPALARDLGKPLIAIADDPKRPALERLAALAAVPGGLDRPSPEIFAFLVERLDRGQPVAARTTAADVVAQARLSRPQLARLTDALATTGPVEIDRLLTAFEQARDDATGKALVQALAAAPALSSVRPDALKAHLSKYGPAVQKEAEGLYARLNVDLEKQKARLEQLLATISTGDVRRGQTVFHGEKAACFSCHAIGYRGGHVGPDLTRIGQVRTERDLLESIVFPSASFVRSFEPIAIATQDGKVYNGLVRSETADELVLATGPNQEARVPRAEIEEMRPSSVSVMPAGFDQQLTPQEIADVVAFLKACR